jgi:hypothetical protein
MSVTVFESPRSRGSVLAVDRGSQITYDIFCIANAGENETEVMAAVLAETDWFYDGFAFLVIKSLNIAPQGGPYWKGTVVFAVPPGYQQDGTQGNNTPGDSPNSSDNNPLDNSFSFEVGGGTSHITASLNTVAQYPVAGFTIPPTKNMIGLSRNRIEGVDIITPKFEFTFNVTMQMLTWGYLKNLRYLVGQVNSGTFLSFPLGELLLLGASGSYKADTTSNPQGNWNVSFKFGCQRNRTAISIGDIPNFAANGWDYVWVGYQDKYDSASGLTVPTPAYASVEQVYGYADFTELGIPGS